MKEHTVTTYAFAELSEEAQAHALDKLRDINTDFEWWDGVYDMSKEAGAMIGIDVDRIYFSGFWSQGDGACFEGSYSYKKGALAAIRKEWPTTTELHSIATDLQVAQSRAFYRLSASVKHRGHYSHEMCTEIDVYDNGRERDADEASEDAIKEALRDFMRWIYRTLEKEHEYLSSDESVRESIEANEYEFTEDGEIYR